MKLKMLMLLLLALIFISETNAQYRDKNDEDKASVGIGPQIGFQKAGDADELRLMFGGFIRAKLSSAFAVEGSINYRKEHYYSGGVTVSSLPVLVSALIYPVPAIYGIAGIGWYFTTISYGNAIVLANPGVTDKKKNPFGFHLGAGVELPLGEIVKLTGDIKYVFLNYNLDNIGNYKLKDLNSNFYIISVGLAFGLR